MSVHTTLRDDLKKAMIAHDETKKLVLRGVLAEITKELLAKKTVSNDVTDDEALAVMKRLVKQRRDSIDQFERGGRADLAASEKAELLVLQTYLPAGMPKDEIRKVAEAMKAKLGVTDKSGAGKLIGAVSKELKGKAEGSDIKDVVESLFA